MKFWENVVFKDVPKFQCLSTEDKRRYITLFKNQYLADWLSRTLITSKKPLIISAWICLINIILLFVYKSPATLTFARITMIFPSAILFITTNIIIKLKKFDGDVNEVYLWLCEKIQNLYLLNCFAISFKDWHFIKKTAPELYSNLRSDECHGKCYVKTFEMATCLRNPKIKILWIAVSGIGCEDYGHAILEKNGFIYDTNTRKTYSKKTYFKARRCTVFREFPLDAYGKGDFLWDDWEEFGRWCKEHNVSRNT